MTDEFDFGSLLDKKEESDEKDDEPKKDVILQDEVPEITAPPVTPAKKPNIIIHRTPKPPERPPPQIHVSVPPTKEIESEHILESLKAIQDQIENLERLDDLEVLQKLITVKNVLNFTHSSWSLGVCKEILDKTSVRGSRQKIANSLIATIKRIAKK